ncbi:cobalamin biosynthesis protein CbiL [Amorphus sp. 3PC139-8]
MRRLVIGLAVVLALTAPAAAHKLKVFAAVKGEAVMGYAFFIGGGRAKKTPWVAKDGEGAVIAEGKTDEEGNFRFVPPPSLASAITITVDTQEGHIASATLAASRFGAVPAAASDAPADVSATDDASEAGKEDIAALVDAAVQRQVEPLLERIEEMDARLRFADILSGIFLIIGLAGMALWARGRLR